MVADEPTSDSDTTPVRAVIADDDPLARRMLREGLQKAGMVVIAEAHDGRQAVELVLHYRPDVVLMDMVMPGVDGLAATRRILKEAPEQVIVILTSGADDEIGVMSLRSGAAGFLSKDVDLDVLPRAPRSALEGEAAISRRLSMRLVERLRQMPTGGTGLRPVKSPLTPREWEVIDLLTEGRTTEQLADALVLSTETVRTHIKNILRKLGARSREEAVDVARRMRGDLPPM